MHIQQRLNYIENNFFIMLTKLYIKSALLPLFALPVLEAKYPKLYTQSLNKECRTQQFK